MENKIKFSDLATILTICGLVLYSLGIIYWNSYFKMFNIDSSFIDFSFEKIISSTWWYLIPVIGLYIIYYIIFVNDFFKNKNITNNDVLYGILTTFSTVNGIVSNLDWYWYVVFSVLAIVVFLILRKPIGKINIVWIKYSVVFLLYISAMIC